MCHRTFLGVFSILSVGLFKLLFNNELFLIANNQNDSCHLLKCTGSAICQAFCAFNMIWSSFGHESCLLICESTLRKSSPIIFHPAKLAVIPWESQFKVKSAILETVSKCLVWFAVVFPQLLWGKGNRLLTVYLMQKQITHQGSARCGPL